MKLSYSCVETRDIAASKAFYSGQLGLKVVQEGDGWFVLDGNGQTIVVWKGDKPTTLMGFVEPKLEEIRATLLDRGIAAGEIEQHPGGRHFMITDPDGNLIMVSDD
ncbi:MAG: VOC family protein [Bacillota bacterium]